MDSRIKVAAYCRVSTDGQIGEDRFGLDIQKDDIQKFAERNNFEIVNFYTDAGVSGSKLNRPALDELLDDAKKGKFQIVVCAKLDRIARDLFAQLFIYKDLKVHGVEINSVAEPMGFNTPSGQLYMQIVGAFAEFERSRISERMASGRIHKAKDGKYAGGRPALGYKADKETKLLKIDAIKANIIQLIFSYRVTGMSYKKIADTLNLQGYTTALNKQFTQMQIKRVIDRSELYKGMYSYGNIVTEGKQPALI